VPLPLEHWSENTCAAYQSDLKRFQHWAAHRGLKHNVDSIHEYILWTMEKQDLTYESLRRQIVGLGRLLESEGLENITKTKRIQDVLLKAREVLEVARPPVLSPLWNDICERVDAVDYDNAAREARDKALLLIAYASQWRRTEICALHTEHIQWTPAGLRLTSPNKTRYKHDPVVLTRKEAHHYCASTWLNQWLILAAIDSGPVFRRIDRWGNIWPGELNSQSLYDLVHREH
jgi:site-specific recombinase XerD